MKFTNLTHEQGIKILMSLASSKDNKYYHLIRWKGQYIVCTDDELKNFPGYSDEVSIYAKKVSNFNPIHAAIVFAAVGNLYLWYTKGIIISLWVGIAALALVVIVPIVNLYLSKRMK